MVTLVERVAHRHMQALSSAPVASMDREALVFPRETYLPKEMRHQPPEQPPGTDLFLWKWEGPIGRENRPAFFLLMFSGKSQKPLVYSHYRNEAGRQHEIESAIATSKQRQVYKDKRKNERANFQHGFQIGDILYASWGYDQTNVDFYQVTDVKGKEITVREIGSRPVGRDKVMAEPNEFIGPPMRKRPQGQGDHCYVKIDDSRSAHEWEGNPLYETGAYGGH